MHEMSLFKDLMGKIESIAKENEGKKILEMRVKLGALSHLSAAHFIDHFNTFSKGTAAEGALLDIVVDDDPNDSNAQEVILESVRVEE